MDVPSAIDIDPVQILDIKLYPNPILKQKCAPVIEITKEIKTLVQNMFATLYHKNGVGLSANQVGYTHRIFVMDTSESGQKRQAFINPEIIESSDIDRWKEGCLSFPDVFAYVKRPTKIKIKALDENGESFELDMQGVDAICAQHEMDHLDGIIFFDHLSDLQKHMIRKKIKNLGK
jgi:peptide deformylase